MKIFIGIKKSGWRAFSDQRIKIRTWLLISIGQWGICIIQNQTRKPDG